MSKVRIKAGTLLSPLPVVMVSCQDKAGNKNIITIAWTGIVCSDPPKTYISVKPQRHSHDMIEETGEFVINLTNSYQVKKCDYCGIFTGSKVDKFKKCDFTPVYPEGKEVSCPMIEESPISICCKVDKKIPLGSHDMFLADIVAVYVNDNLINEDGKISYEKASLCSYNHGAYYAQGKKIGSFGYSAKKKGKNNGKK